MNEPWRVSPGAEYIEGVLSGKIQACQSIVMGVERAVRDHETGPERGLIFKPNWPRFVIKYGELCKQSTGKWAGKPFIHDPWQAFITSEVFGWFWVDTGLRRYKIIFIEIPKKNGKSTYLAVIGNVCFHGFGEGGAQVYSVAAKKDQARIIFDESMAMIKQSPELLADIVTMSNSMTIPSKFSKYLPLASQVDTIDGKNPSCNLVDELHRHKNRKIWDLAVTEVAARQGAMLWGITTAGDSPIGVCWDEHEDALQILEGVVENDEYFAFVATPDKGYDWKDESELYKMNPSLGRALDEDAQLKLWRSAIQKQAGQAAFRRYRFNEWTNEVERWMPAQAWRKCDQRINPDELLGLPCYGGLDLALTDDMSAFYLHFDYNDLWVAQVWYYCCEQSVRLRTQEQQLPYEKWVEKGLVLQTDGNVTDLVFIQDHIISLANQYQIIQTGYDPFKAQQVAVSLELAGMEMVEIRQTTSALNMAMEGLMRQVLSSGYVHNNHPILRWNAFNVVVRKDRNGLIAPDRLKSREKIDGISAASMAISCYLGQNPYSGVTSDFEMPLVIPLGGGSNGAQKH